MRFIKEISHTGTTRYTMAGRDFRCVLTKEQVIEIFRRKLIPLKASTRSGGKSCTFVATKVGKEFGVSPKTIRDIWLGRTWYRDTIHLDPTRADAADRLSRHAGRPKGAKDRNPRQRKSAVRASDTNGGMSEMYENHSRICKDSGILSIAAMPQSFLSKCCGIEPKTSQNEHNYLERPTDHGIPAFDSVLPAPWFPEDFLSDDSRTEFSDPFHDDWAFWSPREEIAGPESKPAERLAARS